MRKDMFKVIVERPRTGGGNARKPKHTEKDYEDLPKKESMSRRRQYGWNSKELNENLSPLERFMRRQVGRPWNKVFSEICENLKTKSTVQQHVRDHVKWMVKKDGLRKKDGKIHTLRYGGKWYEINYKDLYVDPDTGILCEYKHNRYKRTKRDPLDYDLGYIFNCDASKLVVDGPEVYKFFKDPQGAYTMQNTANKHHAQEDFDRVTYRKANFQQLHSALHKHQKRIPWKHPYFSEMLDLLKERLAMDESLKATREADMITPSNLVRVVKFLQKDTGCDQSTAISFARRNTSIKAAREAIQEYLANPLPLK